MPVILLVFNCHECEKTKLVHLFFSSDIALYNPLNGDRLVFLDAAFQYLRIVRIYHEFLLFNYDNFQLTFGQNRL